MSREKIKESNTIEKIDQLTVLAGDIYSGRYYELLAQSGNIGLIRHLSSGIVARNEQQIKLYENKELSLEEWIQFITTVESVLVVQFYESLQQINKSNKVQQLQATKLQ